MSTNAERMPFETAVERTAQRSKLMNQKGMRPPQQKKQRWVTESTTPDPADRRSWKDDPTWHQAGGYYKYNWWGLNNPDGTSDYLAWGKQGQFIYVSPSTNTVVVRLGGGPCAVRNNFRKNQKSAIILENILRKS